VLPQFIGSAQSPAVQMALLGAINIVMEIVLYGGIGLLAGSFHVRLSGKANATAALNYVAGTVYVALAASITAQILAA
jgi:threonine/homoserine/homoserine lactone efflux protein